MINAKLIVSLSTIKFTQNTKKHSAFSYSIPLSSGLSRAVMLIDCKANLHVLSDLIFAHTWYQQGERCRPYYSFGYSKKGSYYYENAGGSTEGRHTFDSSSFSKIPMRRGNQLSIHKVLCLVRYSPTFWDIDLQDAATPETALISSKTVNRYFTATWAICLNQMYRYRQSDEWIMPSLSSPR